MSDRCPDDSRTRSWSAEANCFQFAALVSAVRFRGWSWYVTTPKQYASQAKMCMTSVASTCVRVYRRFASEGHSDNCLNNHDRSIGPVATSNHRPGKSCRLDENADLVTGLSMPFSRSAIQLDADGLTAVRMIRNFESSDARGRLRANEPLTFSSTRGDVGRVLEDLPAATSVSIYQNNSLRWLARYQAHDCSMRKTVKDEKRNVNQRVAVGRMPDCDR